MQWCQDSLVEKRIQHGCCGTKMLEWLKVVELGWQLVLQDRIR